MTDAPGPLPFCPGCGHTLVIKALDKALLKLGRDPREIAIVTDIGCIGLSDRHFITNAFHGLHGRSITYASGLKLARPDMTVIALKGDGGCGIGGTHLLNVARRNIGITLIVGNNFNYGMTGGQHSVTTPPTGRTSTTPWGNYERPMDLCAVAAGSGAAWAARVTAFDKDLSDLLHDAITQPGFALVDIWELCTAHFSPRNKFGKREMTTMLDELGFKCGVLVDNPRPEFSESFQQTVAQSAAGEPEIPAITTRYPNQVTRQMGIVVAGSAGQKIRSTATTLAQAAMFAGLNATQKDDYPITVLTGHSVAEIILSREKIEYTAIESPDCFVLISADGLKCTRARIASLSEECTLYAEESLELPETKARVVRLSLKGLHKFTVATAAVSAMLRDKDLFPTEAFAEAFRTFKRASIAGENEKAIASGAALVGGGV